MPDTSNIRQALYLMRDHARMRLKEYATRHRMRPTGWHFVLDQVVSRGEGGEEREGLIGRGSRTAGMKDSKPQRQKVVLGVFVCRWLLHFFA